MKHAALFAAFLLVACGGTSPEEELSQTESAGHAGRRPAPVSCGPSDCEGGATCCDASCGLCAPAGIDCANIDATCGPVGPRECDPTFCPALASDASWECRDGTQGSYTGRCIEDVTDPRVPAFPICHWETVGCDAP